MAVACKTGCGNSAVLKRPKTGDALCKECFYWAFETEVHHTITTAKLFRPGEFVAVAASGGKDSTVLAHVMKLLNERYDYGLRLTLLSIDEGISGYRDDSLDTVRRNRDQYQLPLTILSYRDLYGWSMDEIVRQVGLKNNCTFCGVFRRQALDRGAAMLAVDQIVTGHNADDIAETIIMNVLRGDVARLGRCVAIKTASEGGIPRSKPFKYTYEKEIVMYAYYKKLDYFSTECIYSPNAYRGYARAFLKDLESVRASSIMDILHSGEWMQVSTEIRLPERGNCSRCGYVSSQPVCKACVLLQGLNQGRPRLGIGKSSRVWLQLKELPPTTSIKKVSGSCQKSCTDCRCRKSSDNTPVEEKVGKVTVDAEVINNLIPSDSGLKDVQCSETSTGIRSDSVCSIGEISSTQKFSELSLNI